MVIGSRRPTAIGVAALAVMAIFVAACSSAAGAAGPTANGANAAASAAANPAAAASMPEATTAPAPAAAAGGAYGAGADSYGKAAATPAAAGGAPVYEVRAASGSVGTYLTGEDGKTLYIFKKDSPSTSVCAGACAASWPPFTLDPGESDKAGAGVTGSLTTFKRADGKIQVAYKGAPVYYFAGDTKAGDTNGQGIGGAWFVAQP
jgi:predicted lipoprotein with Yx(FWY)xxD motif